MTNRRQFIKRGGLWVTGAVAFPNVIVRANRVVNRGGVAPGWHYAEETTFNASDTNIQPTNLIWDSITLPTGNATQIGVYIRGVNFSGTLRLVLYDNAGSKLQENVTSTISTTGWKDVSITSQAVTAGAYKSAYIGQDNFAVEVGYNNGSGTSYYDTGQSGGNAPSTLPGGTGFTGRLGLRIWVE
jgi:hypothetical protein